MTPISQTFTITEPATGVGSVYITAVDLYFRTMSNTYGVEVQIRPIVNNAPGMTYVAYGSKTLPVANITASTDASAVTQFIFDTAVSVNTNQQYAICVLPAGGCPDYNICTAVVGQPDITTGGSIKLATSIGPMFLPSNDQTPTVVTTEAFKYTIYTAEFVQSGKLVYKNGNNDYFSVSTVNGPGFAVSEQTCISNSILDLAALTVSGSNTFTLGEYIYQPSSANGIANAAGYGTVYFANTSRILLTNVVGAFTTTSGNLRGVTSNVSVAQPSVIVQNVSTTANSTQINVPDPTHSDFNVNNAIYVATPNRSTIQIATVLAANTVTGNLTLDSAIMFTTTDAIYGRVRGDGNLYGILSAAAGNEDISLVVIEEVTANVNINFTNTSGQLLIGRSSGTSAVVNALVDMPYESITLQFADNEPPQTGSVKMFQGTSNATSSKVFDSTPTPIAGNTIFEMTDQQRTIMSRSNELVFPNSNGSGSSSLVITANLFTSNTLVAPSIGMQKMYVTTTHNITTTDRNFTGFYHYIENANGKFNYGDMIVQVNAISNTYGTVIGGNSTFIVVGNVYSSNANTIAVFTGGSGSNNIISTTNTAVTANISSTSPYEETCNSNLYTSRYISKCTMLANSQFAEDLICYYTTYRPPGTDVYAYCKVQHNDDSDSFDAKHWSRLVKTTPNSQYSSAVDTNDTFVITYLLPTSNVVYSNGATTNAVANTSAVITLPLGTTTASFSSGQYIYLADVGLFAANVTIVAAGSGYVNGDVVAIANATVAYANATLIVGTNGSGNVSSIIVLSGGNYKSNTAITANPTSNVSGSGTGLTVSVASNGFNNSTNFNVRQITSISSLSTLTVSSNVSFVSGNAAIGVIPSLESTSGAFKYDRNQGVTRYVTSNDVVYDTFSSFASKFVPISSDSVVVPRISDIRVIAAQV